MELERKRERCEVLHFIITAMTTKHVSIIGSHAHTYKKEQHRQKITIYVPPNALTPKLAIRASNISVWDYTFLALRLKQ